MTNSNTHNTGDPGRLQHDLIGVCAVDSGCLVITDPMYVMPGTSGVDATNLLDECGEAPQGGGGVLPRKRDGEPLAVALNDFGGDGVFPVYAVYREGHPGVARVEIRFDEARTRAENTTSHLRVVHDTDDDIVDESAIRHEQTIAELLEGDDEPIIEKLAKLVTTAVVQGIENDFPQAFETKHRENTIERCDELVEAVGLRLLNIAGFDAHKLVEQNTETGDAILDGVQGIESRLRVEPDGLRAHFHEYVDSALRSQLRVEEKLGTGSDDPEWQARRDTAVITALHELIDGMLDAWRVWDVVDDHRMAQRMGMWQLRYSGAPS
ncbi:MAG: hypothetical protein WCR51_12445 [Planctomycetia bacterium]